MVVEEPPVRTVGPIISEDGAECAVALSVDGRADELRRDGVGIEMYVVGRDVADSVQMGVAGDNDGVPQPSAGDEVEELLTVERVAVPLLSAEGANGRVGVAVDWGEVYLIGEEVPACGGMAEAVDEPVALLFSQDGTRRVGRARAIRSLGRRAAAATAGL